ncbi:response regulator [Sphingomonas profundi]|uniref:response regulator n=1 Tax=Alterirhizorhabdus profundi TaxID=2681549 RepID=UPI0012E74026|nr:response regulator [Sphingomonas profundi]
MGGILNILYVDDDDDIRAIVEMALGLDPTIRVRLAAGGAAALTLLAGGGWRPEVIVLDVMMPGMDGPTLMTHLRQQPDLAHVPILFMTARGRAADVARYIEQGAVGVILKPFDPVTLAQQIRALVPAGGAA